MSPKILLHSEDIANDLNIYQGYLNNFFEQAKTKISNNEMSES